MRPGLFFPQCAFIGASFTLVIVSLIADGFMIPRADVAISAVRRGIARSDNEGDKQLARLRIEEYRQWARLLYAAVAIFALTLIYLIARIVAMIRAPKSFFARDTLIVSVLAAAGTGISVPLLLQQDWLNSDKNQLLVVPKSVFEWGKCMDTKGSCTMSALGSICGAFVPLTLLATTLFVAIGNGSLLAENRDLSTRETALRAGEVDANNIAPFPPAPSTQSHSDDGMGAPLIPGSAGSSAKTSGASRAPSNSSYQYHKARLTNGAVVYPSSPASTAGQHQPLSPTKSAGPHTQAPAAWSYNGHPVSAWSYTTQGNNTDMSQRQESLLPPSYPESDSGSTLRPSDSRSNAHNSNPNLLRRSGGASATLGAYNSSRPASRVSTTSNFEWPDWVVAASSSGNGSSTSGSTSRPAGSKF